TFTGYWRAIAGDLPLPDFSYGNNISIGISDTECHDASSENANQQMPGFSSEDRKDMNQQIMQTLVGFIRAPSWDESKRFLESHRELLQPEIDTVLQEFVVQQEADRAR